MLELLISIMMTLGISFTTTDNGQIKISDQDSLKLESSELFQKTQFNGSIDDVVITSGIDPSSTSTSHD